MLSTNMPTTRNSKEAAIAEAHKSVSDSVLPKVEKLFLSATEESWFPLLWKRLVKELTTINLPRASPFWFLVQTYVLAKQHPTQTQQCGTHMDALVRICYRLLLLSQVNMFEKDKVSLGDRDRSLAARAFLHLTAKLDILPLCLKTDKDGLVTSDVVGLAKVYHFAFNAFRSTLTVADVDPSGSDAYTLSHCAGPVQLKVLQEISRASYYLYLSCRELKDVVNFVLHPCTIKMLTDSLLALNEDMVEKNQLPWEHFGGIVEGHNFHNWRPSKGAKTPDNDEPQDIKRFCKAITGTIAFTFDKAVNRAGNFKQTAENSKPVSFGMILDQIQESAFRFFQVTQDNPLKALQIASYWCLYRDILLTSLLAVAQKNSRDHNNLADMLSPHAPKLHLKDSYTETMIDRIVHGQKLKGPKEKRHRTFLSSLFSRRPGANGIIQMPNTPEEALSAPASVTVIQYDNMDSLFLEDNDDDEEESDDILLEFKVPTDNGLEKAPTPPEAAPKALDALHLGAAAVEESSDEAKQEDVLLFNALSSWQSLMPSYSEMAERPSASKPLAPSHSEENDLPDRFFSFFPLTDMLCKMMDGEDDKEQQEEEEDMAFSPPSPVAMDIVQSRTPSPPSSPLLADLSAAVSAFNAQEGTKRTTQKFVPLLVPNNIAQIQQEAMKKALVVQTPEPEPFLELEPEPVSVPPSSVIVPQAMPVANSPPRMMPMHHGYTPPMQLNRPSLTPAAHLRPIPLMTSPMSYGPYPPQVTRMQNLPRKPWGGQFYHPVPYGGVPMSCVEENMRYVSPMSFSPGYAYNMACSKCVSGMTI